LIRIPECNPQHCGGFATIDRDKSQALKMRFSGKDKRPSALVLDFGVRIPLYDLFNYKPRKLEIAPDFRRPKNEKTHRNGLASQLALVRDFIAIVKSK
jgi:hypothetical protein